MTKFEQAIVTILITIASAKLGYDLYKIITGTLTSGDLPFVGAGAMFAIAAMLTTVATPALLARVTTPPPPPDPNNGDMSD